MKRTSASPRADARAAARADAPARSRPADARLQGESEDDYESGRAYPAAPTLLWKAPFQTPAQTRFRFRASAAAGPCSTAASSQSASVTEFARETGAHVKPVMRVLLRNMVHQEVERVIHSRAKRVLAPKRETRPRLHRPRRRPRALMSRVQQTMTGPIPH